jgi:PKD domain
VPRTVRVALGCIAALALFAAAPSGAGAEGWEPTVFALNGTGNAISHPSVAVDDAGNVYAAWIEGGLMEVSKRPVGGAFEQPQTLDPSVTASSNPDIGVDWAGNAVVVWTETVNVDTHTIRQATRAAGASSFGTPTDVNTGNPSAKDNPKLAVNRAGEAVLAIQTPTSGVGTALVALGTAGGGFTAPVAPYSEGPNTSIFPPDAAIDEAGDAVVVWRAFSSGSHRMHAVYRPRGGAFGPAPEDVAPPSSTPRFDPHVAIDSQGRAVAVWDEGGAGAVRAFARGSGAGGMWASVTDLDTQQSGAAVPVVAFGVTDDAIAAWNSAGNLVIAIGRADAPFAIPPHESLGSVSQISIGGGQSVGQVIAWTTGGPNPVAEGSVPNALPFGGQTLSPPGHGGSATDVAVDPSGNAAAVWIDTNPPGKSPRLATAEYDVTRPQILLTSLSLNPTAGDPASFSIRTKDDWSQPTAIWDFGDGGSAIGDKASHTYSKPGTYQATVAVFDGATNLASRTFTVAVAPTPTRGVDFNASQVSGKVLVSVRRKNGTYAPFRRLGANDNIPIGSIIDATHGVAQIETATNRSGSKRQFGRFSQGIFKTQQSKGGALTTAVLLGGGNFRKACKAFGFLAKKRRKPHRRLFGSVHGHFRTRGRHSAATVRGTKWLTQDTCSGTLTVVSSGKVSVLDFGTHKTKLVKKGHRYLARSRKTR